MPLANNTPKAIIPSKKKINKKFQTGEGLLSGTFFFSEVDSAILVVFSNKVRRTFLPSPRF